MRTATQNQDCHRSQHQKAHVRWLELQKRRLLNELRAINRELHTSRPGRVRHVDEECGL